MIVGKDLPIRGTSLPHWARLHLPNFGGVFCNGTVARELPGVTDIQNRLPRLGLGSYIQFSNLLLRTSVRRQVRQVHIMVAVCG